MSETMETDVVTAEDDYNPLLVPLKLYEFFMAHESPGMDAYLVFSHLLYTAKRQHTNKVWATVEYLKKGLSLGIPRVKAAKAFLREHGIIEYRQDSDETGKRLKTYIEIKYLRNPGAREPSKAPDIKETQSNTGGIKNRPPADRTTGFRRQMLEEAIEMHQEGRNSSVLPALKLWIEDLARRGIEGIKDNSRVRMVFAELEGAGLADGAYAAFLWDRLREKSISHLIKALDDQDDKAVFLERLRPAAPDARGSCLSPDDFELTAEKIEAREATGELFRKALAEKHPEWINNIPSAG